MVKDTIKIGVDVDRQTDTTLREWAKIEERSKRVHLKRIARKVAKVWRENPQLLRPLGLID